MRAKLAPKMILCFTHRNGLNLGAKTELLKSFVKGALFCYKTSLERGGIRCGYLKKRHVDEVNSKFD